MVLHEFHHSPKLHGQNTPWVHNHDCDPDVWIKILSSGDLSESLQLTNLNCANFGMFSFLRLFPFKNFLINDKSNESRMGAEWVFCHARHSAFTTQGAIEALAWSGLQCHAFAVRRQTPKARPLGPHRQGVGTRGGSDAKNRKKHTELSAAKVLVSQEGDV